MDVIPLTKFVAAILMFGFLFYFIWALLDEVFTTMNITGTYATAAKWLLAASPIVLMIAATLRLFMQGQKRYGR